MHNFTSHSILRNLASAITRCVSVSAFGSLVGIPIGISSFSVELKYFPIAAQIKKHKSIIKKKRKKHDKRALLAKTKSNSMENLMFRTLINSYSSHDEFFFLVNNVKREYDDMKEEVKNRKTSIIFQKLQSIYKTILLYCLKCRTQLKVKAQNL